MFGGKPTMSEKSRPATGQPEHSVHRFFGAAAHAFTLWAGSTWAFVLAASAIAVWAFLGPVFDYSTPWQLVVNTGTTIVTFLMVFLIQRAQNKDALAIQLKLNEIVAALNGASNRLINVEELSDEEVRTLHERYHQLAELGEGSTGRTRATTIEAVVGKGSRPEHRAKKSSSRPETH
jgi:low affinity Fe/Cu permease